VQGTTTNNSTPLNFEFHLSPLYNISWKKRNKIVKIRDKF